MAAASLLTEEIRNAIIPAVRDHKSRVTMWMVWWPWSMIWTLLNDPIRRMWRTIWKRLQKTYAQIAARAFRSIDDDMVKVPKPAEDDS